MTTIDQAKTMAKTLRASLGARYIDLSHSAALELVAVQLGYDDWNIAAARLEPRPENGIAFVRAVPILRIFEEAKAREFYCGWLGFKVDFEHRFEPEMPLYLGVERAGIMLHLSEHHGDASPGSTVHVPTTGVHALHRELNEKRYTYGRPGIVEQPWGDELTVHDPFGNRLRFVEQRG